MCPDLLRQLEQNKWVTSETQLLVALSGGVDSVVLLHLLKRLSARKGFALTVAHLDHAIRLESREDAQFVSNLCQQWELPLTVERCNVPALARQKRLSLEMAGREARREFLLRTAQEQGADFIVLAHHRDDQAETFLLRLLRGSGFSGLAAMHPCQDRWLRPLLAISREQLLEYARWQGLEWREDLSNQDLTYLRNRVRHALLPQLREYNPRLEERLDLLCRQQQVEEEFWATLIGEALSRLILSRNDGLRLCLKGLLDLHPALQVRILREAIRMLRDDLQGVTEKHLVAVDQLLHGEQPQASIDLPGLWVARRYDQLWLRRSKPANVAYSLELQPPGVVCLPDGRQLRAEFDMLSAGEQERVVEFTATEIDGPLQIRTFRDGDWFTPSGTGGSKKLKDFFIDSKLEIEQRRQVPLVVSAGEILWVAGVRRSALAPVGEKPGRILRLTLYNSEIQG